MEPCDLPWPMECECEKHMLHLTGDFECPGMPFLASLYPCYPSWEEHMLGSYWPWNPEARVLEWESGGVYRHPTPHLRQNHFFCRCMSEKYILLLQDIDIWGLFVMPHCHRENWTAASHHFLSHFLPFHMFLFILQNSPQVVTPL